VLLVAGGKTVKRPVTLGPTTEAQAIVTRGVKPGDVIVGERNVGIVEGIHVKPTALPTANPSPRGQ
jgi:hypothetical protein